MLTAVARPFCSKERSILHKDQIKEQRKSGGKKYAPKVQQAMARQKQELIGKANAAAISFGAGAGEGQGGSGAPAAVWGGRDDI